MQERAETQRVPIKMYRTEGRIVIAAPTPGLEPDDLRVEVASDGRLILHGELRGVLKGMKDLLVDEWSVGNYHREVTLPEPVDGAAANVTYGNGVLVVALPVAQQTTPALLRLTEFTPTHGGRAGNAGHLPQASTTEGAGRTPRPTP